MSEDEIKLMYLSAPASRGPRKTAEHWRINQMLRLDNDVVNIKPGTGRNLTVFPAEIWMEIFRAVDLKTLTLLRHVSKGFRNSIDVLPEYKLVYGKAPYLIRATIISGVASCVTIGQLNRAFRTVRCSCKNCHNDGEFIYLLTMKRMCVSHTRKIKLCSIERGREKLFTDTDPRLQNLPRLTTLIGERQSSYIYVDRSKLLALHQKGVLPAWIQQGLDIVSGRSSYCALKSCVRVPWLDPVSGKLDWGYYCSSNPEACALEAVQHSRRGEREFPRVARSAKSMLNHFKKCHSAQERWMAFHPEGASKQKRTD